MSNSWRQSTAKSANLRARELRAHVLRLQSLDRIQAEVEHPGNILDAGLAKAPPLETGKALGSERGVCEEVEWLAPPWVAHESPGTCVLHMAAPSLLNRPCKTLQT